MQPIGQLMVEHRLIERMISVIEKEVLQIELSKELRPLFVDAAIDFIQIYADQTHHGKEEDILFKSLAEKDLSDSDMKIMNELIQEHTIGRATSAHLVVLVLDYQRGHAETLPVIVQDLKTFVNFYPRHIAKEDKVFFPSITKYFSNQEQQAMLGQFRDFDKELIHEKYRMIVESFEK